MLKDIVVPLTGSADDEPRLIQAEAMATLTGGHVTGLQVHEIPDVIAITDPSGSAYLQSLIETSSAEAARLAETLATRLARLAVPNLLRRVDGYAGSIGSDLARLARTADLYVDVLPYATGTATTAIAETVLFTSGRACLFTPRSLSSGVRPETVLVAWKSTREAAHALAEATPLLARAREVIVALVEEHGAAEERGEEAGVDVGAHLSRHGIAAEVRHIDGWSNVGDALLNEATRVGAQMMVMGAYGHSRLRELVLGGTTRQVLGQSAIPVLVAH